MKLHTILAMSLLLAAMTVPAFADHVTVDYRHSRNFEALRTYSWSAVRTTNSIWNARVKAAVDEQLAAKGWTEVPTAGNVALVDIEKVSVHQEYDTVIRRFRGPTLGRDRRFDPLGG